MNTILITENGAGFIGRHLIKKLLIIIIIILFVLII